jgi:predicted phage baseplate assembly protein
VPIRVSARIPAETGPLVPIGVARGNVVSCDHGEPVTDEPLVPAQAPETGRYRSRLSRKPLTFAAAYDPTLPAAVSLAGDPRQALPAATLHSTGLTWSPRPDLLASDGFDTGFVAEVDTDGTTRLRFGDGEYGRAADPGDTFTANYRIGAATAGNLAAGAITGIDPPDNRVGSVYQPLPSAGGVDPEPADLVKLLAPQAYRRQERAVTEADYAALTQRFPGVQRATARLRWTGSWHTVFVTVDRLGGLDVTPDFAADLRAYLERYRRAGHDLEVSGPVLVPLYLALSVCADPAFLAEAVKAALLAALGALFAPDNLTFGQPVYLSQVYRTALAVAGVASATATAFQRFGKPAPATVPAVINPGPLEILRLANDPNFPEHGKLDLTVAGGR